MDMKMSFSLKPGELWILVCLDYSGSGIVNKTYKNSMNNDIVHYIYSNDKANTLLSKNNWHVYLHGFVKRVTVKFDVWYERKPMLPVAVQIVHKNISKYRRYYSI